MRTFSLLFLFALLALACAEFSNDEFWMEKDYFHVIIVNNLEGRVNSSSMDNSCHSLYMVYPEVFKKFLGDYTREGLRRGNNLDKDCTDTYAHCSATFKSTNSTKKYLVLLNRNWSQSGKYNIELNTRDLYMYDLFNSTLPSGKYHRKYTLSKFVSSWEILIYPEDGSEKLSAAILTKEDYARFVAAPGVLYGGNYTYLQEKDVLHGICDERQSYGSCFIERTLSPIHEYYLVIYSQEERRTDYQIFFLYPEQIRISWTEYIYTAWNSLKGLIWWVI